MWKNWTLTFDEAQRTGGRPHQARRPGDFNLVQLMLNENVNAGSGRLSAISAH
jgi:hypothetical protein